MKSYGLDLLGDFTIQGVLTLPQWTSSYERQILYVIDNKHLYYANDSEWIDLYEFNAVRIKSVNASAIVGIIDPSNIPSDVFGTFVITNDVVSRLLLTSEDVSLGDTVLQKDTGNIYYVVDLLNLDNESGYSPVALKFSRINIQTTPTTLLVSDCNGTKILTNTSSIIEVVVNLPEGEDGLRINSIITANRAFTFKAFNLETIRYLSVVSKSGGYITASDIGHQLQLDWTGTQWIASIVGENWSIETS